MTNGVDEAIHDWVVDHRTELLTSVAWKVTALGTTTFVTTAVVVVGIVLSLRKRSWIPLAACICADLAIEVSARSLKRIVGRPRPPYDDALEHLLRTAGSVLGTARAKRLGERRC